MTNVFLFLISEVMGHYSEAKPIYYIASLDASVVEKANSPILKSL